MEKCNCFCSIIPPFIVKELKKHGGVEFLKESVIHDSALRAKRSESINESALHGILPHALAPVIGTAKRKVYNCNHGVALRASLKRSEGQPASTDSIVNAVYNNSGIVRDFYKNQLNYNSVDNQGSDLILNVHYANAYNNAFWDGDEMIFGDGDGIIFTNFGNSLDVTGHELTHGVVQHTAGLVYNAQPGALNEHMADVFGVTIRQFKQGQTSHPTTANWLIGDTIMGPTLQGQAIRNMKAPGTAYNNTRMGKDPQPTDMAHYYSGTADNRGVHINSGIPNKVYYLVAVGMNDTLKAALLWFETLKTLTPNTNFSQFKAKVLAKSAALAAAHKIPANSHTIVQNAFTTVGL